MQIQKNMIMIVDILPSSDLRVEKYLQNNRIQKFNILPSLYREAKSNRCPKRNNCIYLHELIKMKEFKRDENLAWDIDLKKIPNQNIIIDNGHIANLTFMKISDKKLYKIYMREFKHRKHIWNYKAIVVKDKNAKNDYEKQLNKELMLVLQQSQIEYEIITRGNKKNLTVLREISSKLLSTKQPENE